MTAGGRLLEFALVCLTAAAIMLGAYWLFPYFELVAPVAALIALLVVVNIADGLRFAILHRSQLAVRRVPSAGPAAKDRPRAA